MILIHQSLSKHRRKAKEIDLLADKYKPLSDIQLSLAFSKIRNSLNHPEKRKRAKVEDVTPDVFAMVREAIQRKLGLWAYPEQLIGGMILQEGRLAEMKTGEGKTIVIPFAVALNVAAGLSTHVVTVNEYLARRDAEALRPVYGVLGLSVGVTASGMSPDEKRAAYAADVVYGVNSEFGFDYLRDNMAVKPEAKVQRALEFVVVDEVDSILIDEARTPLIISGETAADSSLYKVAKAAADHLRPEHYSLDEKARQVVLLESGYHALEEFLIGKGVIPKAAHLYETRLIGLVQAVNAALQAKLLIHRDRQYVVDNGQVCIIDENTGRRLEGRRWGEGLHQAVECKEGIDVSSESQTLATISFQNYFRMYRKLAGLTGTAKTEAEEFETVYGLEVVGVPTHRPVIRNDLEDSVFLTKKAKLAAVVAAVKEKQVKGQPVLVGTASVESSDEVSRSLTAAGISHNVLNARNHQEEALVIAQAGCKGAVTVATNMAGRGTDIILGGNPALDPEAATDWETRHAEVLALGGLAVIGTERHDSRRVDNQLRGRSGRQGDPGESKFYLSAEDDLLRVFGDGLNRLARFAGVAGEDAFQGKAVSNMVRKAQQRIEQRNYEARKNLLKFDGVISEQRAAVYSWRDDLLADVHVHEYVRNLVEEDFAQILDGHVDDDTLEEVWDLEGLATRLKAEFGFDWNLTDTGAEDTKEFKAALMSRFGEAFEAREAAIPGYEAKEVLLAVVDAYWVLHLTELEHVKQGVHLRGYAQKDPVQEFRKEAFSLFMSFRQAIASELNRLLFSPESPLGRQPATGPQAETPEEPPVAPAGPIQPPRPTPARPGVRNAPCPCGSGRRFKRCHGKIA